MQTDILRQYIRHPETKQPHGIAIVRRDELNNVHYGFSLCNLGQDQWDKKKGLKIAIARSRAFSYQLPQVKDRECAVLDAYENLQELALKHFKGVPPENIILKGKLDNLYPSHEL